MIRRFNLALRSEVLLWYTDAPREMRSVKEVAYKKNGRLLGINSGIKSATLILYE